jgi:hypothetical protein
MQMVFTPQDTAKRGTENIRGLNLVAVKIRTLQAAVAA